MKKFLFNLLYLLNMRSSKYAIVGEGAAEGTILWRGTLGSLVAWLDLSMDLMSVADVALYVAILGEIGIVPLAVNSGLAINLLHKPQPGRRVMGVCRLMKVGRSLAVGEASLFSEGNNEPVTHMVGRHSIPPGSAPVPAMHGAARFRVTG